MAALDSTLIAGFKQAAADAAAALLEDGMVVGLGSGSTATLAVSAIGKRVAAGLRIVGIPTSEKTAAQARDLGIPLATLEEQPVVDITIDGADEVEVGTLQLIKGGGGNLLREKLVAVAGARFIAVVDEGKVVPRLGTRWAIPVEVIPFGWRSTAQRLEALGANPRMRMDASGQPYITDGGHYILDCACGLIADAPALAEAMDRTVGVVEHGLFLGIATEAIIGGADGVRTLTRAK